MLETKAFRNLDLQLVGPNPQGCGNLEEEGFWRCVAKHSSSTWSHGVGTCKMGVEGDPMAVVGSDFKVLGVQSLRVVDASVFPHVTNANTNAPVMAIAEKAAQLILAG